jgi:hypothetical protein
MEEPEQLHPQQWVKVYGVISNCCQYINTCQVYQLDAVVGNIQRGWFEDLILELIDENQ